MRENTDQNNSEYGHFLRSETLVSDFQKLFSTYVFPIYNFSGLFKAIPISRSWDVDAFIKYQQCSFFWKKENYVIEK